MRVVGIGLGLTFLSLIIGAGCSSTETATPADGDAGADVEAGPTDAGADTAPADDAAPKERTGAIFAISDTSTVDDAGPESSHRAGAHFEHVTKLDTTTSSKTVGPCVVETIGSGDEAVEEPKSAGTVHITGGLQAIDLAANVDGTYDAVSGQTALFAGGETLTVTADGKDVPAFATSLTVPTLVTLTAPAAPGGALTVSRSAGVTATFSGGAAGTVVLYFGLAGQSSAHTATCTFPASAGTGVIPAAAFEDFPAGVGTFDFYVKQASTASPDGWDIRFTVSKGIVDGTGAVLAGDATFQ